MSDYCKGVNFINRGSRCYGIPLEETALFYIRYLCSWPIKKMWKFLERYFTDVEVSVASIKRITNSNDTFIKIKICGSSDEINKAHEILVKKLKKASVSILKVSRRNHKYNFSSLRRMQSGSSNIDMSNNYIDSNQNNAACSSSSTNLTSNSNYTISSISRNDNSLIQQHFISNTDCNYSVYSNTSAFNSNTFPFCLSWNTNGWNFEKRDSIEYFISIYKPLFLCFQETGNGSGSNSNYPCWVRLKNFKHFFKKAEPEIPGKRGLYLGYHNSCHASLEDNTYEYIISLCTYSLWNGIKCSIGNVYVPQRKHSVLVEVARMDITSWLDNHASHPAILLGDFNISTDKLKSWISRYSEWSILSLRGSPMSWCRGSQESDIDHALVNSHMLKLLSHGSLIDFFSISDHKPLLISGRAIPIDNSFTIPKKTVKWDRLKCLSENESIANNNYFRVLEESISDPNVSIDEASKNFISASMSVAKDLNIMSDVEVRKSFYHMSHKIFILQKTKMKLFHELKIKSTLVSREEYCELIDSYKHICSIIHLKCNRFRKEEYQHWINSGCEYMKSHNPKFAWNWIKEAAKMNKFTKVISQSIKDINGNLVSSSEEKRNVWYNHYKKLASDPSGVSLSLDYWENRNSAERFNYHRYPDWTINQDISLDEIKSAILATPNYKASGPDGIPIEFYKAFLPHEGSSDDDTPVLESSGLRCLRSLFKRIWDGEFPSSWNEASIISIPKKGDPTNCDNYRGISLINNGIKLITKIVTTRISEYGLRNNFIRPEQFGFRNKEESVSLFISIREICQRRQNDNKETYLAFLDLKKAYDSVPIGSILHKIECLGIRGKCFQFIKNLYLTSKANVKVDGQCSDSFNIMKGVRQGCPLSPILFNLFINDIFNGCEDLGVPLGTSFCCGGLFADDIVLCAPSRINLKKLLKKVNDWALYNEMNFGINKCATMVIRPDTPLFQNKRDPTFYLAGQPLPITDCYTYLGIPFDKTLSLKPVIKMLNNKVLKALYSVKNFLRNPRIPIPFKKIIINSYIISKVSYYAPLLGSNKTRTYKAQKLVNKALRWAAGIHKGKSFTSVYSISKDFNIPPLSAKCALAQVKCFDKWKNSNCIISSLVNNIPKSRKHPWTKESRTLKYKLSKRGNNSKAIKNFYWNRDMKMKSIKAKFYDDNKFEETTEYMKLCYEYPNLAYGFNWLLRARSGYKIDAKVAKAAKLTDQECPDYCPCCHKEYQGIDHWLIYCPFFNIFRKKVKDQFHFLFNLFSNRNSNGSNPYSSNNTSIESSLSNNSSNSSNSDSNNLSNSSENVILNVSVIDNNVYNNSSVREKVYKFLLGGRFNSNRTREWKDILNCQIKSGNYSDTPFLVITAALLQSIMPIAIGQQWSMFNRFKLNPTTKSVNADNTVRQTSRASATNEDHNFIT